jgi:uncharacterized protein (DUF1499 family)
MRGNPALDVRPFHERAFREYEKRQKVLLKSIEATKKKVAREGGELISAEDQAGLLAVIDDLYGEFVAEASQVELEESSRPGRSDGARRLNAAIEKIRTGTARARHKPAPLQETPLRRIRSAKAALTPRVPTGAAKKSQKVQLEEAFWLLLTEKEALDKLEAQQTFAIERAKDAFVEQLGRGEISAEQFKDQFKDLTRTMAPALGQRLRLQEKNREALAAFREAAMQFEEATHGTEEPMWMPSEGQDIQFSLAAREEALVRGGLMPAVAKEEEYVELLELLREKVGPSAEKALTARTEQLEAATAGSSELAKKTAERRRAQELREEAQQELTAAEFERAFLEEAVVPRDKIERLAVEADRKTAESRVAALKSLVAKRRMREDTRIAAEVQLREEQKAAARVLDRVTAFARNIFNKPVGKLTDTEIGIAISKLGPTEKAQADKFTRAARAIMEVVPETDELGNPVYTTDADGNVVQSTVRDFVRDDDGTPLYVGIPTQYSGSMYGGRLYRTDVINRVHPSPQVWDKIWRAESRMEREISRVKPIREFARRVVDYQKYSDSERKMTPERASAKKIAARNAPRDLGVIQDMIQQFSFELPESSKVFVPRAVAIQARGGRTLRIDDAAWEAKYGAKLPKARTLEEGFEERKRRYVEERAATKARFRP